MIYKLFYVVICFLIFSCDLPDEAEADCNGINIGGAYLEVDMHRKNIYIKFRLGGLCTYI